MNQINKDYVNQSLINQIANLSMQIAERDALITEQQLELEQLRKEQVEEMDENAE
ncbi:MAG TPA: hypothetical protein VK085_11130 [Pseudogracilibacillus sp.]|nr:hypothetical protein [Pseudogracilibacillus sp.]